MNDQVSISTANIRGAFGAFFIPGMYTALWAGFVPYLKAKLSIGADVLGSMILLLSVGSCLSMAIAGKLVESFGCKRVVLLVLLKILSLPVNQSIWGLLIVLFIAMVVVSQFMLTFGSDPNAKVTKKSKSPLSFHPIALIFCLLSFVSYLVEGAVGDWSALYLFEDKGILIEEAVMGVMLFNGTMCIGRLLGNRLGKHLTSKQVVVGGYLLGSIAMGLIVFLPGYASMYTYLLLGISLAMIVPNLFSAMGEQNVIPMTQAVATSTMLGYMGILMGPALIGFIAHGTSLTVAFIVLTTLLVVSAGIGKYAYHLMSKDCGLSEEQI